MKTILLLIAVFATANIEADETCGQQLDFALVVDGSSSVCDGSTKSCPKWKAIIEFCKSIVRGLNVDVTGTRVAFVYVGNDDKVLWDLDDHTTEKSLLNAIGNVSFTGGELQDFLSMTQILTGVFSLSAGDRLSAKDAGLLITDGAPDYASFVYSLGALVFNLDNVASFVVCAPGCKEECAKGIASPPKKVNETYFLINSYLNISQVRDSVVKNICAYKVELLSVLVQDPLYILSQLLGLV